MSTHAYTRCWLHLIWGTLERRKMLDREARRRVAAFLLEYSRSKGISMRSCFVNAEHVHALIDMPTNLTLEEVVKLLKGASSHWINQQRLTATRFAWGRGYGAFSVSESQVPRVMRYIAGQEEHHRRKSFEEEIAEFLKVHGFVGGEEGNR